MSDSDGSEQPIGSTLDALGITAHITPDTLISGAIVLLKTVLPNGTERLSVAHSDGIGWTERAGMLHLASTMATNAAAGRYATGA
jgi:hypothetical protein